MVFDLVHGRKMTTINAENFADYLTLDYAVALAHGVTLIDSETSAIVSRTVEWCGEQGYEISREDAADVLEFCAEQNR